MGYSDIDRLHQLADARLEAIERLRADLELRNQTALDRKEIIIRLEVEIARLRAENERLCRALRMFVGCACPVAVAINPRGYNWLSEDRLDYVLSEAKAALDQEAAKED